MRYFCASSTLPLASSHLADSGIHLWRKNTQEKNHVGLSMKHIYRPKNPGFFLFLFFFFHVQFHHLPPCNYAHKARWSHYQDEVPPVPDEICQKSQKHVPYTPAETDDGTCKCAMFNVCPLNTCRMSRIYEDINSMHINSLWKTIVMSFILNQHDKCAQPVFLLESDVRLMGLENFLFLLFYFFL